MGDSNLHKAALKQWPRLLAVFMKPADCRQLCGAAEEPACVNVRPRCDICCSVSPLAFCPSFTPGLEHIFAFQSSLLIPPPPPPPPRLTHPPLTFCLVCLQMMEGVVVLVHIYLQAYCNKHLSHDCAGVCVSVTPFHPGVDRQAGQGCCQRERCDTASPRDKTAVRSVFGPHHSQFLAWLVCSGIFQKCVPSS